ncbi:hypothetical protein R3P38DRAFT_3294490 [Favolaschia claudopus]|uniref:Uncharacterized protein n=1 Tax=Favolaschia claudopus TaxID=2862362 RepID=A0AAV9ZD30_9AGAR
MHVLSFNSAQPLSPATGSAFYFPPTHLPPTPLPTPGSSTLTTSPSSTSPPPPSALVGVAVLVVVVAVVGVGDTISSSRTPGPRSRAHLVAAAAAVVVAVEEGAWEPRVEHVDRSAAANDVELKRRPPPLYTSWGSFQSFRRRCDDSGGLMGVGGMLGIRLLDSRRRAEIAELRAEGCAVELMQIEEDWGKKMGRSVCLGHPCERLEAHKTVKSSSDTDGSDADRNEWRTTSRLPELVPTAVNATPPPSINILTGVHEEHFTRGRRRRRFFSTFLLSPTPSTTPSASRLHSDFNIAEIPEAPSEASFKRLPLSHTPQNLDLSFGRPASEGFTS